MKLQTWFDTAARGLLAQGQRSRKLGFCAYRGDDGKKCAIGFLIPDDRYEVGMELDGSVRINERVRRVLDITSERESAFLNHLQVIHDVDHPNKWRGALMQLAKDYELEWTLANE